MNLFLVFKVCGFKILLTRTQGAENARCFWNQGGPRWWRSSLGDYRRRQGLSSSQVPRRPSCARSRTRPRSCSPPHHDSPRSTSRGRWRLLLLLFGVARRPRPPPWTDRGSSRSAPTSRLPRRPASRPQFPEEKRGSRMRPGGGASERERGGGGRRRWTRVTRTSEAAAAARAAAHARGRGQIIRRIPV